MTPDIQELRKAAEAAVQAHAEWPDRPERHRIAYALYVAAASPSTILALIEENERLREALGFYAARDNYHDTPLPNNQWKTAAAVFDGGKRARAALKETTDG